GRHLVEASDLGGGESVDVGAGRESRALLHDGPGTHDASGAEDAPVAHDGAGFDDGTSADATAVDHGAGTDDHAVLDDEIVVGEQVQDGVLQDLDVGTDAYRAMRVADDLDAGAYDGAFADDDVAGDLGGREERGRGGDGRQDVVVGVQ